MNFIAAVDENWNIGSNNELLFRLKADMQHFKNLTMGQTVLMGRKTFESIGRPLPNRRNIVLTHNKEWNHPNGIEVIHDIKDIDIQTPTLWCIGGSSLYHNLLEHCQIACITKIYDSKPADASFPNLDLTYSHMFEPIQLGPIQSENGVNFQFITYKRKEKQKR